MSQNPSPLAGSNQLRCAGWFVVFSLCSFTLYSFSSQPPGLTSDLATYTLAGEQFKVHATNQHDVLVSVNPEDISQLRETKLTWWPRSYGFIPRTVQHIIATLGLRPDLGQTMRIIVVGGWLIAILLWSWFFYKSTTPAMLPWLIAVLLCARYSHSNGYLFDGGEFFYWCAFPAVLLINSTALQAKHNSVATITLALIAGLVTPGLVLLKYSAGLSAIGFSVAWMWFVYQKKTKQLCLFYWAIGAGISAGMVLGLGYLPSGNPTLIDSPIQWTPLLWGIGAWLFAMTDLGTLVNKFTVDLLPSMGNHHDGSEGWLFLPLVFLVILILRRENGNAPTTTVNPLAKQLAIIHLVGFSLVLVGLQVRGSAIHLDTRFLRPAAIALMPWIIPPLVGRWKNGINMQIRISAIALTVVLVLVPALYGILSLSHKTFVRSSFAAQLTGPRGLRHDLLSRSGNAKSFFDELLEQSRAEDIIFITDPAMGIPLAARRLFTEEHAHLRTRLELQKRIYPGTPLGQLLLPLPRNMVTDGRARIIQDSFQDIGHWKTRNLKSQPDWVLFIGSH